MYFMTMDWTKNGQVMYLAISKKTVLLQPIF